MDPEEAGMDECFRWQHMRPCRESKCPGEVRQGERPAQAEGRKTRMA